MADELPPPPAYASLFQGHRQAGPSASSAPSVPPILPPDAPPELGTRTPPLGAVGKSSSRTYSRQTSLESLPFPPSHPFYPGPINLPVLTPDDMPGGATGGGAGAGGDNGRDNNGSKEHGAGDHSQVTTIPQGGASTHSPIHMGAPAPTMYPPPNATVPAPYPSAPYPPAPYPPPDHNDPAYPPPSSLFQQGPPQPTDPLINPPFNNADAPPSYPSNYNTYNSVSVGDIMNIPLVEDSDGNYDPGDDIDDTTLVNARAPSKCELSTLDHFSDLHLAEGQREHIDQLDPTEEPAYCKWCLVAFFSLGSHIGFIVCVCILIWQVPLDMYSDSNSWPEGVNKEEYSHSALITASVFIIFCWLVAIIESYVSDTRTYIENTLRLADFRKEHSRVRLMVPTIVWAGEAYHYDKDRVVWKDGRIVGRRRSSETHKCITKYERVAFEFSICVDASGDLDTFQKGVINRFEFEKTFGFIDQASEEAYKFRKLQFIAKFEGQDASHSFEEKLILPEMKEKATVYMTEGCRTSLMSTKFYTLLTLTLLTWPYRIFFRCATRKKKFTFVKLIGI